MKTILAIAVMAALCLSVPNIHANHELQQTPSVMLTSVTQLKASALIGAGRIKSKNANNYVVRSNDENLYFSISEVNYAVGDSVYHSDPVLGWVEILGHAD